MGVMDFELAILEMVDGRGATPGFGRFVILNPSLSQKMSV